MREIRSFSLIFADFCRFSLFLGITAFRGRRFSQKTAGNRRFSQKTAGNRRFLQKPLCPIWFVPFGSALRIAGRNFMDITLFLSKGVFDKETSQRRPEQCSGQRRPKDLGQGFSETGRKLFRRARFQTPSSVSFGTLTRVPGRELSEFLSAYYLSVNSPALILSKNSGVFLAKIG